MKLRTKKNQLNEKGQQNEDEIMEKRNIPY